MRVIFLIVLGLSLLHAELTRDANTKIVKDSASGLEWQDDTISDFMVWTSATVSCDALSLGTYGDWRLPNIDELKSIIDTSKAEPTLKEGFENIGTSHYWSSTTDESNNDLAWVVDFEGGYAYSYGKRTAANVRCVRGGK